MKKIVIIAGFFALLLFVGLVACSGPAGPKGEAGTPGPAGAPGAQGPQGPLAPGIDTGMNVTVTVSKPANGTHLVAGEKAVVTVTLEDTFGNPLTKDGFATLNLYMYGPQETTKTVTSVKLLNASTDRSASPHHYIDLLKDANVEVSGNILKYNLQPVSGEEPGTYTASLWVVKKDDSLNNQAFVLADFQLGTATVEKQIVEKEKCASCHLGADSGKFYLHHIDVGRSPVGNPAIDSIPVSTCKSCHNNDGYAAYQLPSDPDYRVADPIVNRVHGVHNGVHLEGVISIGDEELGTTGIFADYVDVHFPKDILNCTSCHVDDRWKTQPSQLACGACHDNIWFGPTASMPKKAEAHPGGPQADDKACSACHASDSGGIAPPVSVAHDATINVEHDQAVLSMSSPNNGKFYVAGEKPVVTIVVRDSSGNPIDHTTVDTTNFSAANLYVYGPRKESVPVLTAASKLGNSTAKATAVNYTSASGDPKGWTFAAGDTFKIAVNGGAVQELAAPVGLQTPEHVAAWLSANLSGVTVTANSAAGTVTIQSTVKGDGSSIEIYNSVVTTTMGWKREGLDIVERGKVVGQTSGVTMEPFMAIATSASTVATNLRSTTDPAITRTVANIKYQLDDVAGLKPGTYMAYMYTNIAGVKTQNDWARSAFGIVTFQVGTETPDPKVAGSCAQCHGDTVMHLNESHVHPAQFDTDYCKACHDYNRSGTGEGYARVGGTSTSGWAGYGAKPIVARVHGVHFGAYLDHPEEVYEGNPNMASDIIFPQDVRNCTKCHDETTTGTWKTEPSRLACLACHDSDEAKTHAKLMTLIPAGVDPYGPEVVETCETCHGAGKDFSPDKVHNITDPYVPPYPREHEHPQ